MKERKLRVYKSTRNYAQPSIVLQGAWLAEAGFAPGDYISVSCQENRLTIQIDAKFNPADEAPKSRR
jgi:toxic protein SymE